MIRRLEGERPSQTLRRLALRKAGSHLFPVTEPRSPILALRYSNGFVTVEISHDAVERFVALTGDVPLPVHLDEETGDRSAFDARRGVKVVYDKRMALREVTSRSRDGLTIRVNFPAAGEEAVAV